MFLAINKKLYSLIQYYFNKAEKHFFIKATLHRLFACKYYKMDNLESFLKNYDLINFKMNKDGVYKKNFNLMKTNLNTTALDLKQ